MAKRWALTDIATAEQVVKKSRFLAIAGPVTSEDEAKAFISAQSDLTANHNCWAWRVGQSYRFSDDGEPSGTAGKPILQAIDGQSLDHVAVVVTRWFGGILLGSGGLMRAYGGSAATCLREAQRIELVDTIPGTLASSFSDAALLLARLNAIPQVHSVRQDFEPAGVRFAVSVEKSAADMTASLVSDLTSGRSNIVWDDEG